MGVGFDETGSDGFTRQIDYFGPAIGKFQYFTVGTHGPETVSGDSEGRGGRGLVIRFIICLAGLL